MNTGQQDSFSELLDSIARTSGIAILVLDPDGSAPCASGMMVEDIPRRVLARLCISVAKTGDVAREPADDHAYWAVPIIVQSRPDSLLIARARRAEGTSDPAAEDVAVLLRRLKRLAENQHTIQQESEKMTEELDRIFEEFHLFSRIATEIKSLIFSRPMVENLAHEVLDTMRADLSFMSIADRPGHDVMASRPAANAAVPDTAAFVGRLLELLPEHAPVFEDGCMIVSDSNALPALSGLSATPFRCLAVRIRLNNRSYGWLGLVSWNMEEVFRRSEFRLLDSMAEQLALVIANTDLYRDLESFVVNMVRTLVRTIEAKDSYTRGHSERVSEYCMRMADELSLNEQQKSDLRWASLLHDIGKIGIPENILNKPDKLTTEEYTIVKYHAADGAQILQPVAQLERALPGIRSHHERFDGKGYPDGLAGDKIPLFGRIIAVADTFDAVTSSRAYRSARGWEPAMEIIRNGSGTQFEPRMVEAFLKAMAAAPATPA